MSEQTPAQIVPPSKTDPANPEPASPELQSPPEPGEDPLKKFEGLSKDDLVNHLLRTENRLHEVNNESKNRKLKLREMESAKEADEKKTLEEQQKFKELYDKEIESKKDYEDLKIFREESEAQTKLEIEEMEKKIPETMREELKILGDMSDVKKLAWLKYKLDNQTTTIHDTSRSASQSGSLAKRPENKIEFFALSRDEKKVFREKFPTDYKRILSVS